MCPEAQCGQEFIYCFDRNLVFLFTSVHRDFFLRLQAKHTWQCCQKCILSVHRIILRTNTFCRRINLFFYLFRNLGHFSAIIPTFWLNRQNCIPRVEMHFEEVFLGRFFCYFWAWSKKIWSFVEEFLAGFSNFILGVHRNFFGNNLFFEEK